MLCHSNSIRFPYLFLFFALFFSSLEADVIRLNGGQLLEGQVLEESEKILILKTHKGTFTIKKSEILEMERPNSKEKVAKPPADPKLSPIKIAMLSFIPGYSPMYHSKEHPEFGIPFAMVGLGYFYKFLQFQVNSQRVGFQNSVEMKNPLLRFENLIGGSEFIGRTIANRNGEIYDEKSLNLGNMYQFITFRSFFYNGHRDRLVDGNTITEDEYLKTKKRYLSNYIATSVTQAILTYILLRNENSFGTLKTEYNGTKTFFYAMPTADGGVFGTVSRF